MVCKGDVLPLYINATALNIQWSCAQHMQGREQDSAESRAGQGMTGQGKAGQGKARHGRIGRVQAGQGRA